MDNENLDKNIGKLLDGRYELLEVIGHGGMAIVYKARCHLLNRFVAVKILRDDMAADSEFRANFKKEGQAVAMLSHANIVSVYDVSRTPDMDYIVMELLEGITLKQYMKSKGALSEKESLHFSTQIARALAHAHSKGIVHRDIKPQNVMIGMDGNVKVADFGLANLENSLGGSTAIGSVHYISPEQAKGQAADARSDIYSLGVVMYEMLTGVLPFTGTNAEEVARQHISSTPVPPHVCAPELPYELEAIVMKAMEKDPERRYQSADALLHDLDEFRLSATEQLPHITQEISSEAPKPVLIPPDVPPVSRSGELTKENYARRHRRAKKVSLLLGILIVLVFAISVFTFLWGYWLKDIFSDPITIDIPNFVGADYEQLEKNKEFKKIYNFTVVNVADPDVPAGIVIRQEPAANASRALDSSGVDVELTVSAGVQMIEIPDVVNYEYREATLLLQKAGFTVGTPLDYVTDETVTQDYVIETNPAAGDKLPAGSTIYMTVSAGPEVVTVAVPNLVGLSEKAAIEKLESLNLTVGTITKNPSERPKGTIIWQSIKKGEMVNEHERIYMQVSTGPEETEPPEETPEPLPETASPVDPLAPVAPVVNGG